MTDEDESISKPSTDRRLEAIAKIIQDHLMLPWPATYKAIVNREAADDIDGFLSGEKHVLYCFVHSRDPKDSTPKNYYKGSQRSKFLYSNSLTMPHVPYVAFLNLGEIPLTKDNFYDDDSTDSSEGVRNLHAFRDIFINSNFDFKNSSNPNFAEFLPTLAKFLTSITDYNVLANTFVLPSLPDSMSSSTYDPSFVISQCNTTMSAHLVTNILNETITKWICVMHKIIMKYSIIRVEKDQDDCEYSYWMTRLEEFLKLSLELERTQMVNICKIVRHFESPFYRELERMIDKVYAHTVEAKNVVGFLAPIETLFKELRQCDIYNIRPLINRLLDALSMVYQYCENFNTKTKMTSLMVKISNQLIRIMKAHLTLNHTVDLLNPKYFDESITRINDVIDLKDFYIQAYESVKAKMKEESELHQAQDRLLAEENEIENLNLSTKNESYYNENDEDIEEKEDNNFTPFSLNASNNDLTLIDSINIENNEKRSVKTFRILPVFSFSETQLFGNLLNLTSRLECIQKIFSTLKRYSSIRNCKIEGKEILIDKFNRIENFITNKDYDILSLRDKRFKVDYEDFIKRICELHHSILSKINLQFSRCKNITVATEIQGRFELLHIPGLNHCSRYYKILTMLIDEISRTSFNFIRFKSEPAMERNMPPYTGRLTWARSMYLRIQYPMRYITARYPKLLLKRRVQLLVQSYNEICADLVSYEITVYQAWLRTVEHRYENLNAPLMSMYPKPEPWGRLYTNLDPQIFGLMEEIKYLQRLACPLPNIIKDYWLSGLIARENYENIYNTVNIVNQSTDMIPAHLNKLILPCRLQLMQLLNFGIFHYNWHKSGLKEYCDRVEEEVKIFNRVIAQAKNMENYWIPKLIEELNTIEIVNLPDDIELAFDPNSFVRRINKDAVAASKKMNTLSQNCFRITMDYFAIILKPFDEFIEEHRLTPVVYSDVLHKRRSSQRYQGLESNSSAIRTIENASEMERIADFKNKYVLDILVGIALEIDQRLKAVSAKCGSATMKSIRRGLEKFSNSLVVREDFANSNRSLDFSEANILYQLFRNYIKDVDGTVQPLTNHNFSQAMKNCMYLIESVAKGVVKWGHNGRVASMIELYELDRALKIPPLEKNTEVMTIEGSQQDPNLTSSRQEQGIFEGQNYKMDINTIESDDSETVTNSPGESMFEHVLVEQPSSHYHDVHTDRELFRIMANVAMTIDQNNEVLSQRDSPFAKFLIHLTRQFTEIDRLKPEIFSQYNYYEFQGLFDNLKLVQERLTLIPEEYTNPSLSKLVLQFTNSLINKLKIKKRDYTKIFSDKFFGDIDEMTNKFSHWIRQLSKPITSLVDLSTIMQLLKEVRHKEIDLDHILVVREEAFSLAANFNLDLAPTVADKLENARALHIKLKEYLSAVESETHVTHNNFRDELLQQTLEIDKKLNEFIKEFYSNGPLETDLIPQIALSRVIQFKNRAGTIIRKLQQVVVGSELFGIQWEINPQFTKICDDLVVLQRLFALYEDINMTLNSYSETLWQHSNIKKLIADARVYQTRCENMRVGSEEYPAYYKLENTIKTHCEKVELLDIIINDAMRPRHWKKLSEITKTEFDVTSDQFYLKNMLDLPLLEVKKQVEEISLSAFGEQEIQEKLDRVKEDWKDQRFSFSKFKDRGELLLNSNRITELLSFLEDTLHMVSSLMNNNHNGPFRTEISEWVTKLTNTVEVIEVWMKLQNLWVYLEAVFVGGDIAKQLPKEANMFQKVDNNWVKMMQFVHENPNVMEFCSIDQTLIDIFNRLFVQLENCQKSLSGHLERKRHIFPRFFFVADPVLLKILGQAPDPVAIQPHLLAIFENIKYLNFLRETNEIVTVSSSEKETLQLTKPVKCDSNVETWLNHLLIAIRKSMHERIQETYNYLLVENHDVQLQFTDIVAHFNKTLTQINLLILKIMWTKDVTDSLNESSYESRSMTKTAKAFTRMLNLFIEQIKLDLSPYLMTKYESLIIVHVHQRDVFENLMALHIKNPNDFEWQKQTRIYFDESRSQPLIWIADVTFEYQNEFYGSPQCMVTTPLTDQCYITLSQVMQMCLGLVTAGPAGTGKTDTIKSVARCFGTYVIIFNFNAQIEVMVISRILKGLAQSGAWGSLDGFQNVRLEIMSVVAQQIAIILGSKRERKESFIFTDGYQVPLNPNFVIYLTCNPNYSVTHDIPENLKIHFRCVAMILPNLQNIIRICMISLGLSNYNSLAKKFNLLYQLCQQQLSKQEHYDFGLRNVKSILNALKHALKTNTGKSEEAVLAQILYDLNISKMVEQDESIFLNLHSDIFLDHRLQKVNDSDLLVNSINKYLTDKGLGIWPNWNRKLIQMYEAKNIRSGIMVLGPASTGKTTLIRTMIHVLSEDGYTYKEIRINPVSVTVTDLFGRYDPLTHYWTDGIISAIWRKILDVKLAENVWIVLDGPITPEWSEYFHSALDETKTLMLSNGDRMILPTNCKILFESDHMNDLSPAVVSRCAIIFISSSDLPWTPIISSRLKRNPILAPFAGKIIHILQSMFSKTYKYVSEKLMLKTNCSISFYANQFSVIINSFIEENSTPDNNKEDFIKKSIIFTLAWTFGAILDKNDRKSLAKFWHTEFKSLLPWPNFSENVFDSVLTKEGKWEDWENFLEPLMLEKGCFDIRDTVVPTCDNTRIAYLINLAMKGKQGVLLTGEVSCGKNFVFKRYFDMYEKNNRNNRLIRSFHMTHKTKSRFLEKIIEGSVEKRVMNTYGPPLNRPMIFFIDDINLPTANSYGVQQVNELLRQLIDNEGLYNLKKPGEFHNIVDIDFVGTINEYSPQNIPERLKRHFLIFNCLTPDSQTISQIFGTFASAVFKLSNGFNDDVIETSKKMVDITRDFWQRIKNLIHPNSKRPHYRYDLNDLARTWQGLLKADSIVINTPRALGYLWYNEVSREMSDKLCTSEDLASFNQLLNQFLSDHFDIRIEQDVLNNFFNFTTQGSNNMLLSSSQLPQKLKDIRMSHYQFDTIITETESTAAPDTDQTRFYAQIVNMDQFTNSLKIFKNFFETSLKYHELYLLKYTVEHLCRLSRIINIPGNHALLIGTRGNAIEQIAQLAANISGQKFFKLKVDLGYCKSNLHEDIKYVFRQACQSDNDTTFFISDNQILDESFMEYINFIILSNYIPGLFAPDELDEIYNQLLPSFQKAHPNLPPEQENLYNYFIERLSNKLHVVFFLSPFNKDFYNWLLKYPSLTKKTTIDWYRKWSIDNLSEAADVHLASFNIDISNTPRQSINKAMALVYTEYSDLMEQIGQNSPLNLCVIPSLYYRMLDLFKNFYVVQDRNITIQLANYQEANSKVDETVDTYYKLKEKQEQQDLEMIELQVRYNTQWSDMDNQKKLVNNMKMIIENLELKKSGCLAKIEKRKSDINEIKIEYEHQFTTLSKSIEEAIKADIPALIRRSTPLIIQKMMEVILIVLYKKVDQIIYEPDKNERFKYSWDLSLDVLLDHEGFFESLKKYDFLMLNGEMIDLIDAIITRPDYTLDNAVAAGGSFGYLLGWTLAIRNLYPYVNATRPNLEALVPLLREVDAINENINFNYTSYNEKKTVLNKMHEVFAISTTSKLELEEKIELLSRKISIAKHLIDDIHEDKGRWSVKLQNLKARKQTLIGDSLRLAAFVTFCGPFTLEYRTQLHDVWIKALINSKVGYSEKLDIVKLAQDAMIMPIFDWKGFMNDYWMQQNALILHFGQGPFLFLDREGLARRWVQNQTHSIPIVKASFQDKDFSHKLDLAMIQGQILWMEETSEIETSYFSLFQCGLMNNKDQNKSHFVVFNDKEIEVSPNFKIYFNITTSSPEISYRTFAYFSVINFSISEASLENEFFEITMSIEREQQAIQRHKLKAELDKYQQSLEKSNDDLLERILQVKGSFVQNEDFWDFLSQIKVFRSEVRAKFIKRTQKQTEINEACEEYRPLAVRGTILFMLINDMGKINRMYQTGLSRFRKLFKKSLIMIKASSTGPRKVTDLVNLLTQHIWTYIMRGLYKRDQRLATFLMAARTDLIGRKLKDVEYKAFFFLESMIENPLNYPAKPAKWISDKAWINLNALSKLPCYYPLIQSINSNEKVWKVWFEKENPEDEVLPGGMELSNFQKLLLIRASFFDRTYFAIKRYIEVTLGKFFTKHALVNIQTLVAETDPRNPLLALVTPGSDPTVDIEIQAKKLGTNIISISMGPGQFENAKLNLKKAMLTGSWLLVQNCHLNCEFVPYLHNQLETINYHPNLDLYTHIFEYGTVEKTINSNFRVFVTTEYEPNFYTPFLKSAIKFTTENAVGTRSNLRSTYSRLNQTHLDTFDTFHWRYLLWVTAFFHCTVVERVKYGPIGWTVPYVFNQSDFNSSIQFLQNYLDNVTIKPGQKNSNIDWRYINYIISEILYGGCVTEVFDQRLIQCICRNYFKEEIFSPSFHFSSGYSIPNYLQINDYINYIDEKWPGDDVPTLIGLPNIVQFGYNTTLTRYIIHNVNSLLVEGSSNPQIDFLEDDNLKSFLHRVTHRHPPPFDMAKIRSNTSLYNPISAIMCQEVELLNIVIIKVREDINEVEKVLSKGFIRDEGIRELVAAILKKKVPSTWIKYSWDSATLSAWFVQLYERASFFSNWAQSNKVVSFCLGGFFNPQGLLAAVIQDTYRQRRDKSLSLENARLNVTILKVNWEDVIHPPSNGIYVHGLHLEGAQWDRRNMVLTPPRTRTLYDPLPVVLITAVSTTKDEVADDQTHGKLKRSGTVETLKYQCPIYRKPSRVEYISQFTLATFKDPDYWTLFGVALIADIS